jgi:hypothetical protein
MAGRGWLRRRVAAAGGLVTLVAAGFFWATAASRDVTAAPCLFGLCHHVPTPPAYDGEVSPPCEEVGGTWYWLHSPDEEKRLMASLYNRYCIRCHGVDGRGVWDIPCVPDFTNAVWQGCRSDGQLARIILEGRGAVMPPFRGTLSLEEAWAMARYLRTFLPGSETSRPDYGPGKKDDAATQAPAPRKLEGAPKE